MNYQTTCLGYKEEYQGIKYTKKHINNININ